MVFKVFSNITSVLGFDWHLILLLLRMLQGVAINKHTGDSDKGCLQNILKSITLEFTVCNACFYGLISLDFSCLKGKNLVFESVQKKS